MHDSPIPTALENFNGPDQIFRMLLAIRLKIATGLVVK